MRIFQKYDGGSGLWGWYRHATQEMARQGYGTDVDLGRTRHEAETILREEEERLNASHARTRED